MTPEVQVHVRPDAAEFIGEHGGQVYIWADTSGLSHVRTDPPHDERNWARYEVERVCVNLDSDSVGEVRTWTILLHHLPFKRLDFVTDLSFSVGASALH